MNTSKEFLEFCKLYLTTMTSRTTQFCYFNFADNVLILSNSTSGGATEHGDRLMDFSVGELSFHFVSFKDKTVLSQIKELFKIPDTPFAVHIVNLMSLVSKCNIEKTEIRTELDGSLTLIDPEQAITSKNTFGFPIQDFHVASRLRYWLQYTYSIFGSGISITREEITKVPKILDGGLYLSKLDISKFIQEGRFKEVLDKLNFLSVDGLTTVSFKSFLSKHKKPYKLTRFIWVNDDGVKTLSTFSDEHIKVISIRPNIFSLPISNHIHIDPNRV